MGSKEDSHDNAPAEALKLLVQGRAHPLARNLGRTSTPPVVATAEWVHWYGHHPAPFRYRYAHPRRARSRLGTRYPPPGTTTTNLNQLPQNPGLDTYIRADFAELTSTGLMRAAGSPAQEGQGLRRTPPPWDSPEARDQWAQEKLDQGIDSAVVRAARTGDMPLSRPASEATRTPNGSSEGPQQVPTQRESSPGDLTR